MDQFIGAFILHPLGKGFKRGCFYFNLIWCCSSYNYESAVFGARYCVIKLISKFRCPRHIPFFYKYQIVDFIRIRTSSYFDQEYQLQQNTD